ncbi:hypothetical protein AB0J38_25890 [Streptomyces sp. NPDC050095]|uniref:hypothetical protein n=1 Tax=unclassified Streptomyces TaxID=2593676 RepID=UPI00341C160D
MILRLAARVRALLEVVGRLGPGSRALVLRLVGRFGWGPVLAGAVVAVYAAARYRTWIAWGVFAWCAAAWAHAPAGEPDEEPVEDDEPAVEVALVEPDPADVTDVVRDVISTDRGALLTTLAGPLGVADTKAVRQVLAAADIPVREGVRTPAGNGPGVHRDDVPAPRPAPTTAPVGDVAAGEDANANTNNGPTVVVREGMTIITDPADQHRTVSLRKT